MMGKFLQKQVSIYLRNYLKYEHSLSIKAADPIHHPFAFCAWNLVSVAH